MLSAGGAARRPSCDVEQLSSGEWTRGFREWGQTLCAQDAGASGGGSGVAILSEVQRLESWRMALIKS
jgi:hypothetical protein